MKIQFQLLEKNEDKPSSISLTDVGFEIPEGDAPPNIGDYVMVQYSYPEEIKDNFAQFEIISRTFFYNAHQGQQAEIIAVVKLAEDEPKSRFRE